MAEQTPHPQEREDQIQRLLLLANRMPFTSKEQRLRFVEGLISGRAEVPPTPEQMAIINKMREPVPVRQGFVVGEPKEDKRDDDDEKSPAPPLTIIAHTPSPESPI